MPASTDITFSEAELPRYLRDLGGLRSLGAVSERPAVLMSGRQGERPG